MERAINFIQAWLPRRLQEEALPGLSIAIHAQGKPVLTTAFGSANTETAEPLSSGHIFHMASQTKMLTAIACLQLAEKGRLQLDAPAVSYVPWLAKHPDGRVRQPTIKQLLAHQSGLPRDGAESDFWLFKGNYPSAAQLRQRVLQRSLVFEPGTGVKYSNMGYALLGEVIAHCSGQPYAAYVTERIIEPLRTATMSIDYHDQLQPVPAGYGLPHMPDRQRRTPLPSRKSTRSFTPSVGLYATPTDMVGLVSRLARLEDDALLSADSKKLLRQVHSEVTDGFDAGARFGLGCELQELDGHTLFGHSGFAGGHISASVCDPASGVVIALAGLSKDTPTGAIARGLFGIISFFTAAQRQTVPTTFDVHLVNEMSTVQIVSNGEQIAAVDPDCWEPFSWYETLARKDATTLIITTPHSVYNEGELVVYTFGPSGAIKKVRFAGLTHTPYIRRPD